MSHWQPDRLRYKIVLMTSRMSTLRARPPCLAGGTKGSKIAHCSSVRSVAYAFRGWVGMGVLLPQEKTPTMQLRNHLGQDHLPDSLSDQADEIEVQSMINRSGRQCVVIVGGLI